MGLSQKLFWVSVASMVLAVYLSIQGSPRWIVLVLVSPFALILAGVAFICLFTINRSMNKRLWTGWDGHWSLTAVNMGILLCLAIGLSKIWSFFSENETAGSVFLIAVCIAIVAPDVWKAVWKEVKSERANKDKDNRRRPK